MAEQVAAGSGGQTGPRSGRVGTLVYRLTRVSQRGRGAAPAADLHGASGGCRPARLARVARLVESVPNFSEGRRPDVVDRLAEAISVGPRRPPPRPDERRQPQPHGVHPGRRRRCGRVALEAAVAVAVDAIDMELHTGEHPRIGAVDVIPFVPLATPRWTTASRSPARSAARIAERFELPVYLYARAAMRPDREKLADVRRGQYEGLKAEIGRTPTATRLRSDPDPPDRRGGRGRCTAVPDRLQHQSGLDRPRARQAHRAHGPRVGWRPGEGPGQRLPAR